MQKLSLLLLGILVAWLGARLVGSAESFAPHLLRDASVLAVLGAAVFGFNALGWEAPPVFRRRRGLPAAGRILLWTGLLTALIGGLLREPGSTAGLSGVAGLAAAIAWWLGLLLAVVGAWWPGPAVDYAQPQVRWGRDAAGRIVPLRAGARTAADPLAQRRTWLLWMGAVLLLAAVLRFWEAGSLPPTCVAQECEAALRAGEGPGAGLEGLPGSGASSWKPDLLEMGARLLLPLTGSGLLSLRLAAGVTGWLTVLILALALRRLVNPSAALLGTVLLAISPWHLWAGRSSDPWLVSALLSAAALWLGLEALARAHVRWWVLWGLAAGGLAGWPAAAGLPGPALGAAAWAALAAGLGFLGGWRRRSHAGEGDLWQWPLTGALAAVGLALGAGFGSVWGADFAAGLGTGMDGAAALTNALLRPETTAIGSFMAAGLAGSLIVALAAAGVGALLRHGRRPQAWLVLGGMAGLLLGTASMAPAAIAAVGPSSLLLPLLPLLLAAAAAALDVLLRALVAAWGPPLAAAAKLVAAAGLVLLLLVGRGTMSLLLGLDVVSGGPGASVASDMARYIGEQLRDAADATGAAGAVVTYIVPRRVIDDPSLQLLAGAALADGRVQPLELGRTLPYTGPPGGDVVYLLPLPDGEVLNLLRQLYGAGEASTELDAAGERALFNRFVVREAALAAAQTLQMTVMPGAGAAVSAQPDAPPVGFAAPLSVSALDFPWGSAPPRALPFTAEWTGALVTPESGAYRFLLDSSAPESVFTLLLDDVLVLDSTLGMRDQQLELPQGIHRLHMTYRSGGQPGDLRVRWQTPDGGDAVLAAPALHSPALPDQGLFGDYYANDRFEGAPVATRKDPVIGLDPGLAAPYSVRWHGLLAAPRSGEYLLGADAGGFVQLVVDGQAVADNRAGAQAEGGAENAAGSTYTEGLIYLAQGWHTVEVRFAPDDRSAAPGGAGVGTAAGVTAAEAPGTEPAPSISPSISPGIGPGEIRLLWQPPGSNPGALTSLYLLPAYGQVGPVDAPLPSAPLADALLGGDTFALSRAADVWQPHLRVPPSNLPPLPLERLWGAGDVCGSGDAQFSAPHGVAFSPGGDKVYVADTGNRRIQVYSVDGAWERSITSDLLQEPVAVEVASDGTVLVLDALAQGVFRVEADGALTALPQSTGFYRPRGFGLDLQSNMAIADTGGARVAIVQPDGALAGQFGGQGTPLGRGQPVDALAAEGALWAISAEDGRLWNLNVDGSLTAVQPTGTVDGPHLAALADGRLLASDPARGSFILFSPFGEPQGQFAYAGELLTPTGIAAARIGEGEIIVVADTRACTLGAWRLAQ